MNILMTGGSGFIGSHLAKKLTEDPSVQITNIDLVEPVTELDNVKTIISDIRKVEQLMQLPFSGKFDMCIHLAALCKEPGFEWAEYFDTNHKGTINVLQLCDNMGISKIFFTSTMMVYKAGEEERTEESPTNPDTAYGISKLLAEKEIEIWSAKDLESRVYKIIRPAVVFGENENANFTRLYGALKKGFFPFVGKSSTVKSSIYVKELVNFLQFLISEKTKENVFNFAFPEDQSIRIIVKKFKEVFNIKAFNPVIPYKLLIWISFFFEFINSIGIKNAIHHRRIEKLFFSTNLYPDNALKVGYKFKFDFRLALIDWKESHDKNF